MFSYLPAPVRHGLAPLALAAMLVAVALPAARAQAPAQPMLASGAQQISFSLQVANQGQSYALSGQGETDGAGALQLSLTQTQPQAHTAQLTLTGGTLYLSQDGGPYAATGAGQLAGGLGGLGGLSGLVTQLAGCSVAQGIGSGALLSLLGPNTPANGVVSQNVAGQETVDGVLTNHLADVIELDAALGQVGPALQEALSSCGVQAGTLGMLNSPFAGLVLSGSSLDIDLYSGVSDNVVRRINAVLAIPNISLRASLQIDLTPLDQPVTITAPAGSA